MQVGITGTRQGATRAQLDTLYTKLTELGPGELHHGDCVGVDAEVHVIAESCGYTTVVHPPKDPKHRAFCKATYVLPEKDYLARNLDIVYETSILFALPKSRTEEFRGSGTWHAIRCAKRLYRKCVIIWPDGTTEERK